MSVIILGDRKVTVWSGDPVYGDPKMGVFYMEPPYTPEQFARHREECTKRWLNDPKRGLITAGNYVLTTPMECDGPFRFHEPGREDLSEDRSDLDEYQLHAFFKAPGPEILPMGEVEDRRLMAQRYGLNPAEPTRGDPEWKPTTQVADEMDEYRDPNGLTEAGLAEGEL